MIFFAVLVPVFVFASSFVARVIWEILGETLREKRNQPEITTHPFVVSEYYDRMEKAGLQILEQQESIDKTITLWWGLYGLRLNEDGSLEWVNRKKRKFVPIPRNALSPPERPTLNVATGSNILQDRQEAIQVLQMQLVQQAQLAAIINAVRSNYPQAGAESARLTQQPTQNITASITTRG